MMMRLKWYVKRIILLLRVFVIVVIVIIIIIIIIIITIIEEFLKVTRQNKRVNFYALCFA